MGRIASQFTSLTIAYSIVYSGVDQRKHQSPASLAFVRGIHRRPVNSPRKWPVTRKKFPFDDVIMWKNCLYFETGPWEPIPLLYKIHSYSLHFIESLFAMLIIHFHFKNAINLIPINTSGSLIALGVQDLSHRKLNLWRDFQSGSEMCYGEDICDEFNANISCLMCRLSLGKTNSPEQGSLHNESYGISKWAFCARKSATRILCWSFKKPLLNGLHIRLERYCFLSDHRHSH